MPVANVKLIFWQHNSASSILSSANAEELVKSLTDGTIGSSSSFGMVTRREFLDHGAHLALGVSALQAGLGRLTFLNGLGVRDVGE
jgi:hypothetical protein